MGLVFSSPGGLLGPALHAHLSEQVKLLYGVTWHHTSLLGSFQAFLTMFRARRLEAIGKHQRAKIDGCDVSVVSLPYETEGLHPSQVRMAPDLHLNMQALTPSSSRNSRSLNGEKMWGRTLHQKQRCDVFYRSKWDPQASHPSCALGWVPAPASLEVGTHRWLTPPIRTNSYTGILAIPHKWFRNNSQRGRKGSQLHLWIT